MTKEELLELKERVEQAEKDLAEHKGVMKQLKKELEDLGYSSIEKAEKAVEDMKAKVDKIQQELDAQLGKIEELLQ